MKDDFAIEAGSYAEIECGRLTVADGRREERPYRVSDPEQLTVEVGRDAVAELVVFYGETGCTKLSVRLAEGAQLHMVECFCAARQTVCEIEQAAGSVCRSQVLQLTACEWRCRVELSGAHAENRIDGLFLLSGDERSRCDLRVNHRVADCTSRSLVKGVATDRARGEFAGLVYVAQDAQRTDARQSSRNIVLSPEAHIHTEPQLEIYADDVKCSHGATVGQLDGEQIYYMRQRGLDERVARRLQLEGFASEVACPVALFREEADRLTARKLERI